VLLRVAGSELRRRSGHLRIAGPELDDLAYQAAADALLAITRKLSQFDAESRFTTWADKVVILEVSAKVGQHFWRTPGVPLDAEDWERAAGQIRGWRSLAEDGVDSAYESEKISVRAGSLGRCVARPPWRRGGHGIGRAGAPTRRVGRPGPG
jgi:hypothetical protein